MGALKVAKLFLQPKHHFTSYINWMVARKITNATNMMLMLDNFHIQINSLKIEKTTLSKRLISDKHLSKADVVPG